MCKTDIYKILEYESFKYNFFIKKKQNDFISEEFSSYEEEIYGKELCKIYEDLYKINYGKRYIKELIAVLFLYIMSLIFNKINITKCINTHHSIINLINIFIGVFLLVKVLLFKTYYNFLLYKFIKLRKK